jgi:hypothetical protein
MNAPSIDIKDMLTAESDSSLTYGENLFINLEPTAPPDCVTIFDTQGYPPALSLDGTNYEYPSVQIRVRARKQDDAWRVISEICESLHGRIAQTWNGTYYTVIKLVGTPALLDWDDNRRCRFVLNFNIQRR